MRIVLFNFGLLLAAGSAVVVAGTPVAKFPAVRTSGESETFKSKASDSNAADTIQLNFPENVELRVLLDYFSHRLGVNFVYDDQVVSQHVTIKSPSPVTRESLPKLLDLILLSRGLIAIDGDEPGWKRIVASTNLASAARPSTQPIGSGGVNARPGEAITQVFLLRYAEVSKAEAAIKPFLTPSGGATIPLPDQHLLLVSDYAANIARMRDIVDLVDQPPKKIVKSVIAIKNLEAQQLAQQLTALLTAESRAQSASNGAPQTSAPSLEVSVDGRTNRLVLIGTETLVSLAVDYIQLLDIPLQVVTKTYQFQSGSPERVDRLARDLIGPSESKRIYQSTVDREDGFLIVTAPEEYQQRVADLKKQLDVPNVVQTQSPIRFYRLESSTAADVLQTIQAIAEGDISSDATAVASQNQNGLSTTGDARTADSGRGEAPTNIAAPPSAYGEARGPNALQGAARVGGPTAPRQMIKAKDATITADPNTNSIIVVAQPDVQRIYEQLIKALDKRRPQVLIECTIVTLDTSNNFSFGVEISGRGGKGSVDFINFSSFGLSTVGTGADLGKLTLNPGLGFNGTLINSDIAQLAIKALVTSGRADVVSAPKIVVNDNTTGTLASVQEAPFTSVNASTTVATTAFAGYASAGTTIAVTPHISDGDFLQLEYSISLNSFTGAGNSSAGTPPPRQTNELNSKVTIPDGSTIIVGGLNRKNYSKTVDAIPILGQIPILQYFFSSRTENSSESTLFVFIRPVVLRDDKFADLKFLSEREFAPAGIRGDFPHSEPVSIR